MTALVAPVSAHVSATTPRYATVDDLLAAARDGLERLSPAATLRAVLAGARTVDIRPAWQRSREGEIPGSLVVERNHLEWRLHPASAARLPHAHPAQQWVVVCSEGYTSSLAAAALRSLGLAATDLDGGFHAWAAAGLPVTAPGHCTPVEQIVPGAAQLLRHAPDRSAGHRGEELPGQRDSGGGRALAAQDEHREREIAPHACEPRV